MNQSADHTLTNLYSGTSSPLPETGAPATGTLPLEEESTSSDEPCEPTESTNSHSEPRIIKAVRGLRHESVKKQLEADETLRHTKDEADRTLVDVAVCSGEDTNPDLESVVDVLVEYGIEFTLPKWTDESETWEKLKRRRQSKEEDS